MEILMLLALPLMLLGGFTLDAATGDDDDDREVEVASGDPEQII
jgi:hypothetical protein